MIKLILVEDDVKLNHLIKTILERNNYEVDAVYNPVQALECMEKNAYSLIISDIMMPEIDGFEFARIIRQTDKDHVHAAGLLQWPDAVSDRRKDQPHYYEADNQAFHQAL